MKESLYNFFVRKNPLIGYEYERYVKEHIEEHETNRLEHWKLLIKLNFHYRLKREKKPLLYKEKNKTTWQLIEETKVKQNEKEKRNEKEKQIIKTNVASVNKQVIDNNIISAEKKNIKLPCLNGVESRSASWLQPHDLVRKLMNYDIISFDIFDTLIFRPLELPRHLFLIVGNELNLLNFPNIRVNAENKVREEKFERNGNREVTIWEIYKEIEKQTGLNQKLGVSTEIRVEMDLCYANPYMKYVFDTLKGQDKKICIVSDMYLSNDVLSELLDKCGYKGYEELFVSCDYGCSKKDGQLYEHLKEYAGEAGTIIHVGDNKISDIKMAQERGIDTYFYESMKSKGGKYRTDEIRGLVGSAYRGIVNNHLHNGYKRYDAYYEYGFIYGGLFMLGFAEYIHKYARDNKFEKVLFVARDGYVMKQVYDGFFKDIPSEYILCSRMAMLKMSAYCNKNSYMKEYVYRWVQDGIKIKAIDVLDNMELYSLSEKLEKYISLDCYIDANNVVDMVRFVNDYWKEIVGIYNNTIQLAKPYYASFFENYKKVLVIDIGWRGQTIMALRNLERDYWHFGCDIVGMLAASAPTYECQGQLQAGIINTYMFSPIDNIICFNSHSKNSINNILTELFAGAPMPSFIGFKEGEGEYNLEFDVPETSNYEIIQKVHNGILDFAHIYKKAFLNYEYMCDISGYDAYMPIKHIFKDYSYIKRYFARYEFQDAVGGTVGKNSRTIRDIFNKFKL